MKTVGIIAEYNPFHNGHLYQIQKIKEQFPDCNIVVAMSGDYVQRGTPAWTHKYLRTKMAMAAGVDFVFELPVIYATASAGTFAWGGVALLSNLGFVDTLVFGAEWDNLGDLQAIADAQLKKECSPFPEKLAYRNELLRLLNTGMPYPRANALATMTTSPELDHIPESVYASPNNILAIEYLKAIKKQKSHLTPVLIKREGSGYHDQNLSQALTSATAIRENYGKTASLAAIADGVPDFVMDLLKKSNQEYAVNWDDYSNLLYYTLQSTPSSQWKKINDYQTDLSIRIENLLPQYRSASQFTALVKTKNYTYTRINRFLLHLLLQLPEHIAHMLVRGADFPYLRVLGMNRKKSNLLKTVTKAPLIVKTADAEKILTTFYNNPENKNSITLFYACSCWFQEVFASNLYRQVLYSKTGVMIPDEYRAGIVFEPEK